MFPLRPIRLKNIAFVKSVLPEHSPAASKSPSPMQSSGRSPGCAPCPAAIPHGREIKTLAAAEYEKPGSGGVGVHLANVRESAGGGAGPAHSLLLELFLQQP